MPELRHLEEIKILSLGHHQQWGEGFGERDFHNRLPGLSPLNVWRHKGLHGPRVFPFPYTRRDTLFRSQAPPLRSWGTAQH